MRGNSSMSDHTESNVISIRRGDLDTESKVLAAFERVRAELAVIDSIEDAFKVREKAELLRVLATKIKASKSTLDEIAAGAGAIEENAGGSVAGNDVACAGNRSADGVV